MLLGLTGQVSFGHVGFYAIGAYTVAILTTKAGFSFWLAWPVAALLGGAAGALLALPALRVKGPYLAMITIAFGFIVEHGIVEARGLTGGQNGMMGIAGAGRWARRRANVRWRCSRSAPWAWRWPATPGCRAAPGARRCARCATPRPRPNRSA